MVARRVKWAYERYPTQKLAFYNIVCRIRIFRKFLIFVLS